MFFDTIAIDSVGVAVRRIWMATQDYAGKDYKADKTRLAKAKTALQDVAQSDYKTLQEGAKSLMSKIDAIDVTKAGDKIGTALEALWQDARKLMDQPQIKGKSDADPDAYRPAYLGGRPPEDGSVAGILPAFNLPCGPLLIQLKETRLQP